MLQDRLKTLWRWLTTKKQKALLFPPVEFTEELRIGEPKPDELALGIASFRNEEEGKIIYQQKGVAQETRGRHFYIVGATGSGKTKFLETLLYQDIKNGLGFGIVDPHGDLTEDIKGYLYLLKGKTSDFLQESVVLIDPTDKNNTVTFNPLEQTTGESPARVASELTEAFKKIWKDAWGARMEDLLKNTLIALIENNLTLAELRLFLTDPQVRQKVLEKVNHDVCREYFEQFNSLPRNKQNEWMESTLNKVDAFVFDPDIRQMLASPKSSFNLREVMDEGKILLVKLDKGRLKGNADLLGSLLLAKIQAAAFSRTDILESERRDFYLYIDEFQNFATESFITMLSEARKYRLALTLAHQQLAQLPTPLRAAILSNCRLQAYFQISRDDSNILAKESLVPIYNDPPGWEWYVQQLQELGDRQCVIKNKNDGGVIAVETLGLPPPYEAAGIGEREFATEVAEAGIGQKYLRDRKTIEEEYQARRDMLTKTDESESFREPKKVE